MSRLARGIIQNENTHQKSWGKWQQVMCRMWQNCKKTNTGSKEWLNAWIICMFSGKLTIFTSWAIWRKSWNVGHWNKRQQQIMFWHHEFGHTRSWNNMNIWDCIQMHKSFLDGTFAKWTLQSRLMEDHSQSWFFWWTRFIQILVVLWKQFLFFCHFLNPNLEIGRRKTSNVDLEYSKKIKLLQITVQLNFWWHSLCCLTLPLVT